MCFLQLKFKEVKYIAGVGGDVIIWLRCHGIILRRRYFVGRGRRPRRPLKNIKIPIAFGGGFFLCSFSSIATEKSISAKDCRN